MMDWNFRHPIRKERTHTAESIMRLPNGHAIVDGVNLCGKFKDVQSVVAKTEGGL